MEDGGSAVKPSTAADTDTDARTPPVSSAPYLSDNTGALSKIRRLI